MSYGENKLIRTALAMSSLFPSHPNIKDFATLSSVGPASTSYSSIAQSEHLDSGLEMENEGDTKMDTDDTFLASGDKTEKDFVRSSSRETAAPASANFRSAKVANESNATNTVNVNNCISVIPSLNSTTQASPKTEKKSHLRKVEETQLERTFQLLLPNKDGDTGLHLAVIFQDYAALEKLLQFVAQYPVLKNSVNDQNNLYQTPLHLALHTYQSNMVRKFLISGASLNIMDHKGNTALHVACTHNSTKCLDEILGFSSVPKVLEAASTPNHDGFTCVHLAAIHGSRDILKRLRRIGVNMNLQDLHSGKTVLHMAMERKSLADVHFLVETCGVDVNATTYTGCSPLHIAAGRGSIECVAYLLSVGGDPELQTDEGDTALNLSTSDDVTILLTKVATLKWHH